MYKLKKFVFSIIFNLILFLILMIGTQNSSSHKKVNLLISETIKLPIGFIIGLSFIGGSITSNLLEINFKE
tara:strand:- start:1213 stop:1425 length:213 start_codon:yes stop_codon:yes gene_type:complete